MAPTNLSASAARCMNLLYISSRHPPRWRLFTTSRSRFAEDPSKEAEQFPTLAAQTTPTLATSTPANETPSSSTQMAYNLLGSLGSNLGGPRAGTPSSTGLGFTNLADKYSTVPERYGDDEYHLHVFSTRHNTHLTLSSPERKALISISAGNLGFRKSQRGSFDAGYQLMAYLLTRMQQQGLMAKITKMELALRGFGQGRDAVTKVLLGTEGTRLRDTLVRVVDKTRLKIGGPRSPRPRRLG